MKFRRREEPMQAKTLEIRDKATFIPALAIDMNPAEVPSDVGPYDSEQEAQAAARAAIDRTDAQRYLLRRSGYLLRRSGYAEDERHPTIMLTRLSGDGTASWSDVYGWADRTFTVAHNYIESHWYELKDGDVIDVEFILGETKVKKVSE